MSLSVERRSLHLQGRSRGARRARGQRGPRQSKRFNPKQNSKAQFFPREVRDHHASCTPCTVVVPWLRWLQASVPCAETLVPGAYNSSFSVRPRCQDQIIMRIRLEERATTFRRSDGTFTQAASSKGWGQLEDSQRWPLSLRPQSTWHVLNCNRLKPPVHYYYLHSPALRLCVWAPVAALCGYGYLVCQSAGGGWDFVVPYMYSAAVDSRAIGRA